MTVVSTIAKMTGILTAEVITTTITITTVIVTIVSLNAVREAATVAAHADDDDKHQQ